MQGLFIGCVVLLVVVFIILGIYQSAKRRKELMAWAQSKGLSFSAWRDWSLEQRFPQFKCLRQGSDRYAYNIMEGDWSGRRFIAFDYHYETESTGSKGQRQSHDHTFSAVIIRCNHFLKPLFIRPERFFDKFTEFLGFDDIDFESAEFSRKFYVRARDKRWAYDVIHARTMQFLLDMPQFTVEFDPVHVIAYRSSRFKTTEFESAAEVVAGILDRMPEYLLKELKGDG